MRHLLIIATILTTCFASCTSGTVEGRDDDSPKVGISFSSRFPSSRSSIIDTGAKLATAGGFNVWAYSHTGTWSSAVTRVSMLENVPVTSDNNGTSWEYGAPVYWPDSDQVSFFAYGPAGKATAIADPADGVPAINFVVDNAAALQADLLIATNIPNQLGSNYGDYAPVNLTFNHALSQVKFSALLSEDFKNSNGEVTETVKITKVELKNVSNDGEISLQAGASWQVSNESSANYTLVAGTDLENITLTTSVQRLSTEAGTMFLMPQAVESGNIELAVTLTFNGIEMNYAVPLFSPVAWLPGKSYDYQLFVEKESIQIIVIDNEITLDPWTVSIAIQPVPLSNKQETDLKRLKSALSSLAHLRGESNLSGYKYYAIYLRNDVNHDITVDMDAYNDSFGKEEQIMFDAKKIINSWKDNGADPPVNYTFTVNFDPLYWRLMPAAQPIETEVDGYTYATTQNPVKSISNKGSIILEKLVNPE